MAAPVDISSLDIKGAKHYFWTKVTPWEVEGAVDENGQAQSIDYNKLIASFGTKAITPETLTRVHRSHGWRASSILKRGSSFLKRLAPRILDLYEHGEPFFLYTSEVASSNSMHLGHMVPLFLPSGFARRFFDVPLVIGWLMMRSFCSNKIDNRKCQDIARRTVKTLLLLV